jgi:hypothetical protein
VIGISSIQSRTLGNEVIGILLRCRRLGSSLAGNEVLGSLLRNIETLNFETHGYVLGSDDGTWLGDRLAEILGALGNAVLGISLLCRRNKILGISFDIFETLWHVLGSDDGTWLEDRLSEMIGDTLGRALWNEVIGISIQGRTLGNEVLGISLL